VRGISADSFDAEDAVEIVSQIFHETQRTGGTTGSTDDDPRGVRAVCVTTTFPIDRAETVELPLWLTNVAY